jgi:hypothetical protein
VFNRFGRCFAGVASPPPLILANPFNPSNPCSILFSVMSRYECIYNIAPCGTSIGISIWDISRKGPPKQKFLACLRGRLRVPWSMSCELGGNDKSMVRLLRAQEDEILTQRRRGAERKKDETSGFTVHGSPPLLTSFLSVKIRLIRPIRVLFFSVEFLIRAT